MTTWFTEEEKEQFRKDLDAIKNLPVEQRTSYQVKFLQAGRERGSDDHFQRSGDSVYDQLLASERESADRSKNGKPKRNKSGRNRRRRTDGEVFSAKNSFKKPEGW